MAIILSMARQYRTRAPLRRRLSSPHILDRLHRRYNSTRRQRNRRTAVNSHQVGLDAMHFPSRSSLTRRRTCLQLA